MRKAAMLTLVALTISCAVLNQVWAQVPPAARKVNLNTATVAELDTLPGIGPTTAARIIEFRSKNGAFKKPEDVMAVKGIGEKKFLKLKERITVGGAAPASAGGTAAQAAAKPAPRKKP